MITRQEEILKAIVKELHEMNKKLDRIGQASIFSKDVVPSYSYEEDKDELAEMGVYIKEIIPNSQDKHIV